MVEPVRHAASYHRALAALEGLALGDALGMPTQSMSHPQIIEDYGVINGLVDAGPRQRIAAGMAAGSVTDDTEQAVLLARLLIDGRGRIDAEHFAHELLAWEERMAQKGSLDLLGPSTKMALKRLAAGVPAEEAGRYGTTNGAAMRITPVGIAFDAADLPRFLDAVEMASAITHSSSLGLGAAAAIGAAVSVGVGGGSLPEAIDLAVAAAEQAERRGRWAAGGSIAARVRWAVGFLRGRTAEERLVATRDVIGTSVAAQESVVAALALAATADDPWQALCLAATAGGDTDTVAAMAGAVLGATSDDSPWPEDQMTKVEQVNNLGLDRLADDLVSLRASPAA